MKNIRILLLFVAIGLLLLADTGSSHHGYHHEPPPFDLPLGGPGPVIPNRNTTDAPLASDTTSSGTS